MYVFNIYYIYYSSDEIHVPGICIIVLLFQRANPVMGCSDVLSPLKSLYLLSPAEGSRSIFLISDGFVENKELFQTVAKHSSKNRLFCMGVG